jgi:hypothetical protein
MLNLSNPFMKLVIDAGKMCKYQVRAICTSQGEANALCSVNPDIAPICEDEKTGLIFLADIKPIGRTDA